MIRGGPPSESCTELLLSTQISVPAQLTAAAIDRQPKSNFSPPAGSSGDAATPVTRQNSVVALPSRAASSPNTRMPTMASGAYSADANSNAPQVEDAGS